MAICTLPELLNENKYPLDVKERAKRILDNCGGGSIGMIVIILLLNWQDFCNIFGISIEGAYTESSG